jgi:hypothetical protein
MVEAPCDNEASLSLAFMQNQNFFCLGFNAEPGLFGAWF